MAKKQQSEPQCPPHDKQPMDLYRDGKYYKTVLVCRRCGA
jgi:hypothetical protein